MYIENRGGGRAMEVVAVGFLIWFILTISIITGAIILVILNKSKKATIALGLWTLITFILFIITLLINRK